MNKSATFLALGLVLALLLGACSAAQAAPISQEGEPRALDRTLTVNGTGRVSLTPDLARIFIGVQTENEDAQEAVGANNTQAQEVIDTLKDFGIEDKDIRTTNFSIYPRQDFDREGKPLSIVYVVQNTVLVTLRELDQVGEVLDAVVQVGANTISGIEFDVADRVSVEADALQDAVRDARSRAEVLAQASEVELGQVLSINTSLSSGPPPVFGRVALEFAEVAAEVPISPGEMEITADVMMVFEIK